MRSILIGLAATTLAGCTATMSDPGQAVPESSAIQPLACNLSRAEGFIGKPGDAVAEEARAAVGATSVRVIRPGQAVTQDYRADRLNIEVDDSGNVVRVRCG
ncbi:hypothetical protein ASE00_07120 [Sphingomonas sp. Root710]|uniref:I78 family peptidase inhibitor n=1 Tax=Sphingomonas sp. Root710 TaxID=1736594 RepID=UPI0006FA3199|nr:I78 family peptidase inhibitor [Sphingomonas sp. Root710]KRB86464.1 hypothetical protein ASE00_07120 [Sphingomonas sp. Root710]